jgi:hypothetical protein
MFFIFVVVGRILIVVIHSHIVSICIAVRAVLWLLFFVHLVLLLLLFFVLILVFIVVNVVVVGIIVGTATLSVCLRIMVIMTLIIIAAAVIDSLGWSVPVSCVHIAFRVITFPLIVIIIPILRLLFRYGGQNVRILGFFH